MTRTIVMRRSVRLWIDGPSVPTCTLCTRIFESNVLIASKGFVDIAAKRPYVYCDFEAAK